jgi:hypothetical protein
MCDTVTTSGPFVDRNPAEPLRRAVVSQDVATILIVEADEPMRRELATLETPHALVIVESAQKAWSLVEAGFSFDDVIYFADPVAETLLYSAAVDHETELTAYAWAA